MTIDWTKEETLNNIKIIEDDLKDVSDYSIYNDDIFNEEIYEIKEILIRMKLKLKK